MTTVTCSDATNKEFNANWTATNYAITLKTNDGTFAATGWSAGDMTGTYTKTYSYASSGSDVTIPDSISRSGYTFAGWKLSGKDDDAAARNVTVSAAAPANVTYEAVWSANSYAMTLNTAGGTISDDSWTVDSENAGYSRSYTIEDEFVLPIPVMTDDSKVFAGWIGTGLGTATESVSITGMTGAKTYTATWTTKLVATVIISKDNTAGVYEYGDNLTATSTITAPESGYGTVSYQWLRDGEEIEGATTKNYRITANDLNAQLSCRIETSNTAGAAVSDATTAVVKAKLTITVTVTSKTYDGTTNATIAYGSITGEKNGETHTPSDTTSISGSFEDAYVGIGKTVTTTQSFVPSGDISGYDVEMTGLTGDITAAAQSFTVSNITIGKGESITKSKLKELISGVHGVLTYTQTSSNGGGTYNSTNGFVAAEVANTKTETLQVTAAALDLNGDGVSEYEAYTVTDKVITITVTTLPTQVVTFTAKPETATMGDEPLTVTAISKYDDTEVDGATMTYATGDASVAEFGTGEDANKLTIKKAGTVRITATAVAEDYNDGVSSYDLVISPATLIAANVIPTETAVEWSGEAITILDDETGYSVSGNNTGTDIGEYTVTVTPAADYVWDDGSTAAKSFTWSIVKAAAREPAPTGLTGVTPTSSSDADGKITGLASDKTYEYATGSTADSWAEVTAGSTEITGLAAGTYYVRVKNADTMHYEDNPAASVTVPGYVAPSSSGDTTPQTIAMTGIKLSENTVTLKVGENKTLTATKEPANTTDTTVVSWSSSDESVASVVNGVVTAKKAGKTKITASAGSFKAECEITVEDVEITGIAITPSTAKVAVEKTTTLTVTFTPEGVSTTPELVWTSSDDTIAAVADGVVTGVKAGEVTITAALKDNAAIKATATITVEEELIQAEGITISPATATVEEKGTAALSVAYAPENQNENPEITWTSSDPAVATVAGGVVTAVSEGTVTITATATNAGGAKLSATAEVQIKGHSENPEITVEGFDEDTLKAAVTAVCPTCGTVLFEGELTAVANADGSYKFTFTSPVDNKTYSVNWFNHEHKWSAPAWTFDARDYASATFTCTAGKETKTVKADVGLLKTNTRGDSKYQATVTGPDGRSYSTTQWFDPAGNKTTGGGISIEGLEDKYPYTGAAIKPSFIVMDNDLDAVLALGTDYTLGWKNNTRLGSTATVTVNGKGNYSGKTVTGSFTIINPAEEYDKDELQGAVKKIAKITGTYTYNGLPQYPASVTVTTDAGDVTLTGDGAGNYTTESDKTVAISISNNVNAGTATVAATGADGKTKKTTFKIAKADLSTAGTKLAIDVSDTAYAVKGAVPEVSVTYTPDDGPAIELIKGQDYAVSVKYANNKNAAEGNAVTITGKGTNFTKKATAADKFTIGKHELTDASILSVTAFAGTAPKSIKAVVVDGNGVVIPAKQYKLTVTKGSEDVTASKTKLAAGDEITVTVAATEGGNLSGDASMDVTAAPKLSAAKVTLSAALKKNGVEYVGEPIDLTSYGDDSVNYFENDGIKVQLKNASKTLETLEYGTDYVVTGYQNNNKKGTMTVYITGISEKCSGTKSFKVKISAKVMKKSQ